MEADRQVGSDRLIWKQMDMRTSYGKRNLLMAISTNIVYNIICSNEPPFHPLIDNLIVEMDQAT